MSLNLIEDAIEKIALLSAANTAARFGLIGGAVGAFRKKDKDESRLHSILRSAGTGAAVGAGGNIAARGLAKAVKFSPGKAEVAKLVGDKKTYNKEMLKALAVLGGGTAGSIGAYHLAKRKENK